MLLRVTGRYLRMARFFIAIFPKTTSLSQNMPLKENRKEGWSTWIQLRSWTVCRVEPATVLVPCNSWRLRCCKGRATPTGATWSRSSTCSYGCAFAMVTKRKSAWSKRPCHAPSRITGGWGPWGQAYFEIGILRTPSKLPSSKRGHMIGFEDIPKLLEIQVFGNLRRIGLNPPIEFSPP